MSHVIGSSVLLAKGLGYSPIKQYAGTNDELRLVFAKQSPSVFSDAYFLHQVVPQKGPKVLCDSSQILQSDHPLLPLV